MTKFEEIVRAWRIKWNPTDEQKTLSKLRLDICAECPSRNEVVKGSDFWVLCNECGCPLEAKSHSPVKGACPLGKWDVVENQILKQ
jgi:hypothetical protein